MNIQMLSHPIYNQVFQNYNVNSHNIDVINKYKQGLEKHGIIKESDLVEDVDFIIPPLEGKNLEEHFKNIGENQCKPYKEIIDHLLLNIPPKPENWLMQPGWTRYAPNEEPQKVDYPLENGVVFDVEVCLNAGQTPTLATAVTSVAWYGWIAQSLIDGVSKPVTSQQYLEDSFIPFESAKEQCFKLKEHQKMPKVIVGHNVSYDRLRIKEQYWLNRTGTRFLDTMSLHICVSGVTSYQRAMLKSNKSNEEDESWQSCSSLNSLSDVHNLYCGSHIDKETRDIFVDGTLSQIKEDFNNVMNYCAADVIATYNVLKVLYPMFTERFPHPVTLAGMLELSTAYLPINNNWERYINESEQTYDDLEIESRLLLARRADQACQLLHNDKYKEDLWMWDQDWEVKDLKIKKTVPKNIPEVPVQDKSHEINIEEEDDLIFSNMTDKNLTYKDLKEKFQYLNNTQHLLPANRTLLAGYPNWYRKLCTKPDSSPDWIPGPHLISASMQVTPKLLNLTWEGYPLHYIRGLGWGLLVPFTADVEMERKLPLAKLLERCPVLTDKSELAVVDSINILKDVEDNLSRKEYYSRLKKDNTDGLYKGTGIWCKTIVEDCCFFFKLPHKDGATNRVGNPLSKDFLNKFSENVLAGDSATAERILEIARGMSYWRNNRDRIMKQMVVWLSERHLPFALRNDGNNYGAILPQVVVCGTLTRRAVEPTWMTASNAHPERIGSELRAMVQAPPGYYIVGADVDSQELWIASILGDSHHAKIHGATPLGWMTLSGSKSNGTDMHSVTAKAVGISRDHAKVINYARIYGAGQNFAERLIRQFNPSMTEAEARKKATKMFNMTKGKLIYRLKPDHLSELPDVAYSKWNAMELAKLHRKTLGEMFLKPKWVGGTESAMFNRLEEIAGSEKPTTPFLDGRLSRALEPSPMSADRFLTTRVNWVVQSGAVDFLHLMLVSMRWIMGDRCRFCLSFHDEIRYLVPEEYKYKAALAMHVTNLLTRAFCSIKLGIYDLPQSVAFFSSVEIDKVLRKEAKLDCKTPSNPHGLERGYGIVNGESLDIYQAIEKGFGKSPTWYKDR
ncbi:tam [Trypoxylus dichotomus]